MGARAMGMSGIIVLLCGVLAACTPTADDRSAATASAVLSIRAGDAQVESADGVEPAVDGQELAPGDIVTVSGDGAIVELAWSDGSVTRLGPDTIFTVGSPGEPLSTRGVQEAGISWNRVSDADAEAAAVPYLVDLAEGDRAGDRGSLFVINCQATPCRVVGTGGNGADGSKTSFRRGGVTTEVVSGDPAAWGQLMVDDWAEANAELDVEAGLAPVADLFDASDPSRGLVDGTYSVLRTQTQFDCTGSQCAKINPAFVPGYQRTLVFRFHTDCGDAASACTTMVDTQALNTATAEVMDSTVPLVSGASSFAWGTEDTGVYCVVTQPDGSQTTTGKSRNMIRWEVTPTKAEVIDGIYRVTELTGGSTASFEIVEHTSPEYPGCEEFEYAWDGSTDLELTWLGEG